MFIPKKLDVVTLRCMDHYTKLGLRANWQRFRVDDVGTTGVSATMLNGAEPTTTVVSIPIPYIDPPFGFHDVYELHHESREKLDRVISWIPRGIAVWTNHELVVGRAGQNSFTPADCADGHDWRFAGKATEVLTPEDCRTRFRLFLIVPHPEYDAKSKIPKKTVEELRTRGWCAEFRRGIGWDVWREELYWPKEDL